VTIQDPIAATAGSAASRPAVSRAQPVHVSRFDAKTRALHVVIMVTFLGLSVTGMPLLFSDAPWARLLATVFGGFRGAGLVHRVFGATLLAAVVWHVSDVCYRAFVRRERGLFWGPDSMVPQLKDVTDFYGQLKWFLGLGPQPRFEHFTYWEKFDYWAVLWGTVIMGAAGLVLWFPIAAAAVPARLDVQRGPVRSRRGSDARHRLHLRRAFLQRPPAAGEVPDGSGDLHRLGDQR
jgi:cytochrome b subunit of formate dehydrogenase